MLPICTACEYGPMAAGAASEWMILRVMAITSDEGLVRMTWNAVKSIGESLVLAPGARIFRHRCESRDPF